MLYLLCLALILPARTPSGGTPLPDAPLPSGGYGMNVQNGACSCAGPITATFTWQPDDPADPQADPPPQSVLVKESASVTWHGLGPGGATGSASNGVGGVYTLSISSAGLPPGWEFDSGTSASPSDGARYTTRQGGQAVTLDPVTMTGRADPSVSSGLIAVYGASISPVTPGTPLPPGAGPPPDPGGPSPGGPGGPSPPSTGGPGDPDGPPPSGPGGPPPGVPGGPPPGVPGGPPTGGPPTGGPPPGSPPPTTPPAGGPPAGDPTGPPTGGPPPGGPGTTYARPYFSGTGCSVNYTAAVAQGYVLHAQVEINGTVVKEYADTSEDGPFPEGTTFGTGKPSVPMSGKFDSTYFPDGTPLTITMTGTDSSGNPLPPLTTQGPTYNKAVIYGNDYRWVGSLTEGIPAAQNANAFFSSGISEYSVTPPDYTANDTAIYHALPTYTAFYIWTHGNATNDAGVTYASFGDCYYAGPTGGESLTETPVGQNVSRKTASQPPYNFVFIDSCLTQAAGDMPGKFGIPPSNIASDQAYLGFKGVVSDDDYAASWSEQLFTNLNMGDTVGKALTETIHSIGFARSPDGTTVEAKISGDSNAKVCGVYGSDEGSTQWFKFP